VFDGVRVQRADLQTERSGGLIEMRLPYPRPASRETSRAPIGAAGRPNRRARSVDGHRRLQQAVHGDECVVRSRIDGVCLRLCCDRAQRHRCEVDLLGRDARVSAIRSTFTPIW